MNRRSFFGLSLGALLARWLPKVNPPIHLTYTGRKWVKKS